MLPTIEAFWLSGWGPIAPPQLATRPGVGPLAARDPRPDQEDALIAAILLLADDGGGG